MARPKKEPIKNGKIWLILGVIFVLSVPWYFPQGSYKPLLWGIPLWGWVIVVMAIILSAFLTYVIKYHWHLEEDEEEESSP